MVSYMDQTKLSGVSVQELQVKVTDAVGGSADGVLTVHSWDRSYRMKRALKILGGFWFVGLFIIPLPLIHFTSPLFLLAGPVLAYLAFYQEAVVAGGRANCPKCGKQFEIARRKPAPVFSDLCNHCQSEVKVFVEAS